MRVGGRRLVPLLLLALVLVNLPWAHRAWQDHRIAAGGRLVSAPVTASSATGGSYLVQFRLPASVDRGRHRYTARLDRAHYREAVRSGRVGVRVVPGHPSENRVVGATGDSLLWIIAAIGDAILLLLLGALWWRRRRWSRRQVLGVAGRLVSFRMGPMLLTAQLPAERAGVLTAGDRLPGRLVLTAESDVRPGPGPGELERVAGAGYRARGRVSDVDREHAVLALDNGYRLRVVVGPHRNRADLRELAEVTGTLRVLRPGE